MASSLALYDILDANKLIEPNNIDWLRNLRIVLIQKKISYILDTSDPGLIRDDAIEEDRATYKI